VRLLEHEGKQLLARHAIPVPRGGVWPDLPQWLGGDLVVKAQTLGGGRGTRGGVLFASGRADVPGQVAAVAAALAGAEPVHAVYVEERVDAVRELYLAAMVDRDSGQTCLLAGSAGGVEVELANPAGLLKVPVDALTGLLPEALSAARRHLGLAGVAGPAFDGLARSLHRALVEEDAELIEVNPLFLTPDGRLVAGDARVVLDDDALSRHPDRPLRHPLDATAFEREASRLGVIGIQGEGEIAFLSNGAGLAMATLDQLSAAGGRVAAMVELHGIIGRGPSAIAAVVELIAGLQPRVLLVNVFYHLRPTSVLAEGIALALDRMDDRVSVVVRIRGAGEAGARSRLGGCRCLFAGSFHEACAAAVRLAGG
jgi:succinyl-CoA synthetase beta subunit